MRRALLALTALSAAVPAQATPVVLTPSSPWNVDFGENKCRLARFFGEGDDRHILSFEQYWPERRLGLMAAGRSFKPFDSGGDTDLQFFAAQTPMRTQPFTGTAMGYGTAVIYSSINLATGTAFEADAPVPARRMPQLDTDLAAQVEFVGLKQGKREVRLVSGSLRDAFKVLNQCTEDLVASWGLDIAQHRTMTRMPLWTNAEAISRRIQESYPLQALVQGEQAILRMRVIVSETGAVESCVLIEATAASNFDSPACERMKRAIFESALDAAGKPMRSYYATSITYRLG